MLNSEYIKNIAKEVGFDLCGITSIRNFDAERSFFDGWLLQGYAAGMEYLARNVEKRFSPEKLVPGVRTVIVCGVVYKNDTSLDCCGGMPKIASYARSVDYHTTIKQMMAEMSIKIKETYSDVSFRSFTDSAPVLEKRLAVEAGLGFVGRNKLVISPRFGSFMVLGELFVDKEVDCYDSLVDDVVGCGNCSRCVDSCPNGALTDCGLDARKCISRLTIEKPTNATESDGETNLHGWAFGCDICQSVCPYNIFAPLFVNHDFTPLFDPRLISVDDWAQMTNEDFASIFSGTPLERAGYERVRQSALLMKR